MCGQTVWRITSAMSQCHAGLRGWRRATGERETCWRKRGVSPVSGMIGGIVCLASIVWADRVANYGRDVAVPCGFVRPWWKMRLRGAVPLGSAKHAGVNAACRWRAGCLAVSCDRIASSLWADRAANYVRDVAVPCGFARPWYMWADRAAKLCP